MDWITEDETKEAVDCTLEDSIIGEDTSDEVSTTLDDSTIDVEAKIDDVKEAVDCTLEDSTVEETRVSLADKLDDCMLDMDDSTTVDERVWLLIKTTEDETESEVVPGTDEARELEAKELDSVTDETLDDCTLETTDEDRV